MVQVPGRDPPVLGRGRGGGPGPPGRRPDGRLHRRGSDLGPPRPTGPGPPPPAPHVRPDHRRRWGRAGRVLRGGGGQSHPPLAPRRLAAPHARLSRRTPLRPARRPTWSPWTARSRRWCSTCGSWPKWRPWPRTGRRRSSGRWTGHAGPSTPTTWPAPRRRPGRCWRRSSASAPRPQPRSSPSAMPISTAPGCGRSARPCASAPGPSPTSCACSTATPSTTSRAVRPSSTSG